MFTLPVFGAQLELPEVKEYSVTFFAETIFGSLVDSNFTPLTIPLVGTMFDEF